jgi:hypothetical protein
MYVTGALTIVVADHNLYLYMQPIEKVRMFGYNLSEHPTR